LNISREGDSTASLGSLLQCSSLYFIPSRGEFTANFMGRGTARTSGKKPKPSKSKRETKEERASKKQPRECDSAEGECSPAQHSPARQMGEVLWIVHMQNRQNKQMIPLLVETLSAPTPAARSPARAQVHHAQGSSRGFTLAAFLETHICDKPGRR